MKLELAPQPNTHLPPLQAKVVETHLLMKLDQLASATQPQSKTRQFLVPTARKSNEGESSPSYDDTLLSPLLLLQAE